MNKLPFLLLILAAAGYYAYEHMPAFQFPAAQPFPSPSPTLDPQSLMTSPKIQKFQFYLDGEREVLDFRVYGGVNDHLSGLDSFTYWYDEDEKPTQETIAQNVVNQVINEPVQQEFVGQLLIDLKARHPDWENARLARAAISLVQNIPYDKDAYDRNLPNSKHPYQVLFYNKGVCAEKARLLALLLAKLGFGVAMLEYDNEKHEAVGLECTSGALPGSGGYCFVESTSPTMISDSEGDYIGAGKLTSLTSVIRVSRGNQYPSEKEAKDASIYLELRRILKGADKREVASAYSQYLEIRREYGLEETKCKPSELLCNGDCWTACKPGAKFKCTETGGLCEIS